MTAFTLFAALFDLIKTLPAGMQSGLEGALVFARQILPWFDLNLGWVIPALLGFGLGMAIRMTRKKKA